MVVANYLSLTSNLGQKVKRVSHGGRSYLVAPASLIVPGVLNGSDGALYYPPEEVSRNTSAWDGVPLVVYHPTTENGEPVSALDEQGKVDRGVYERVGVGALRNTRYDGKRLVSEAWFDEEHVKNHDSKLQAHAKILPRLNAEQSIELSTGLHVERDHRAGTCPRTNRSYDSSTRNYRPDHLAVLPDQRGACSVEDGCGVVVNSLITNAKEKSEGKWVTLPNGVHIMVKDGEIVHGPEALKSKKSTENAGKYGNPQCGDTGKFMPHGFGTGKGETHAAAKEGRHGKQDVTTLREELTENDCAGGIAENCSQTSKVMNAKEPEGQWITISGTHVLVKDGEIIGGPPALVGKGKTGKGLSTKDKLGGAYTPPKGSIYADVPRAGNNISIHDTPHAKDLVSRLDKYERKWIDYEAKNPKASEAELHREAMHASGLLGDGLTTARGYADKKASSKPGVFFPNKTTNQSGDMTMDPKERTSILTKLVTNCECSEEDAKVLNTLSDSALLQLNAFPMAKQKDDPEDEGDGGDDEEMEKADGSKKVPPQFAKNRAAAITNTEVTVNQEQIETALAKSMGFNDSAHMKATLNVAKRVEFREREALLTKLVANVAKDKQEATWNAFKSKPIDELQAIVDLIPAPRPVQNANPLPFPMFPTYAGASGFAEGQAAVQNAEQDLLDIPTINWNEKVG